MSSTTSLLNLALARIGAGRIVSLDDTTAQGQLIRDTYDDIRQELIRSHPWNFCTYRSQISREAAETGTAPTFSFRKPGATDTRGAWLRTISVFGDASFRFQVAYQDERGLWLADVETLWTVTIHDVTDPNRMDPLFRGALSLRLSAEYAIVLSNSNKLHDTYLQRHEAALTRAKAIDAMDSAPDRLPIGTWESDRWGVAPDISTVYQMP